MNRMTTTRRTVLKASGLVLAAPAIVQAQGAWPNKPITIVVNFPAGGLTDGIARAFGQHVQQVTGQQVIKHPIRLELGVQDQTGPRQQGGQGLDAKTPDMKQGQERQDPIVVCHALRQCSGPGIGQQITLGVYGTLGATSGARGVDQQHGQIVGGMVRGRNRSRGIVCVVSRTGQLRQGMAGQRSGLHQFLSL